MRAIAIVGSASLCATLAIASSARAERGIDGTINPGLTASASLHDRGVAPGLEISGVRWLPSDNGWLSIGPIVQATLPARNDTGTARYRRLMLGGEIAWTAIGIELGYAYQSASDEASPTHAVHLAPFLSLGVLSIAAPINLPFAHSGSLDGHPIDFGVLVAVKLPLLIEKDGRVRGFWAFFEYIGG